MAKMGRPSTLTDESVTKILGLLREGIPLSLATSSCGVREAAVYDRMRTDDDFRSQVEAARSDGQITMFRTARAGDEPGVSFGPAKANLELLGRVNPKQFAQRVNVKVEDELRDLLRIGERVLDADSFEKLLEAVAEWRSGDGDGICAGEDSG
jgi:hypothetical protein